MVMKAILSLIITGIMAPFLKSFIETYVAPETGLYVIMGLDENVLAFIGLIPWLFPLACFVWVIIAIAKGHNDDEEDDNYINRGDARR